MKPNTCDVLIEGGLVIDGTGAKRMRADVAVAGERISAVGNLEGIEAKTKVSARDRVVTPGFIDAHTHDDRVVLSSPDMTPKISQGVTTVIAGNCGVSLAPLVDRAPPPPLNLLGDREWYRFGSMNDYAETVEANPPAVNIAIMVGHSTLRVGVMADLTKPATRDEIDRMGALLEESLQAGCIGMSTGLAYPTAKAAPTEEVVALAEHLAAYDGIYATHMRDEGDHLVESVEETLEIGRRAGVPVVISHHKSCKRRNWGRTRETLAMIAAARQNQSVNLDVYPYTASSTVLLEEFVKGAERVIVTWSEAHPEVAGRDFAKVKQEWGCSTEEAISRLLPAGAIYYQMHEDDLRRVMSFTDAMIGSDGLPHDVFPHPRLWGTFPRVLGYYCRDLGLFSLEEAVRRMAAVPASVFNVKDRGVIREGALADLVIFDPETVIDKADFDSPKQPAAGIDLVMVNGKPVWRDFAWTGERPGKLLRRQQT
ncbi:MAG: amidohydrolase family protein [Acidiferrobacterales bacterium]